MKTQVWLDYKVGGCRNIASVFLDSSQSEMQVDSHWFSYGFDSEGQVFVKDISDSIEDLRIYLRGQFVRPHWSLLTSSYLPILILILLFLFGCCVRFIYVLSVEQHKKQLLEVPRDEEVLLLSDFIPQEYENNLSVQSDQGLHTLDTIDDRPRIKQNSNVTRKKQKPKYTFRQSYGKLIEGKFELAYQEIEKNFSMYPMKEQVKAKKILGRMYRDRCDSLYQRALWMDAQKSCEKSLSYEDHPSPRKNLKNIEELRKSLFFQAYTLEESSPMRSKRIYNMIEQMSTSSNVWALKARRREKEL